MTRIFARYAWVLLAAYIIGIDSSTVLFAGAYKWVDDEGQIHYGDRRPAGVETETPWTPPPIDRDEVARRREQLEKAERKKQRTEKEMEVRTEKRHAEAAAKEAEKQRRASETARCLALRLELEVFDFPFPLYRDEKGGYGVKWQYDTYQGERRYLDDDERSVEIERVRVEITAHCGDPDDPEARRFARQKYERAEHCASRRADLELFTQKRVRALDDTIERQRRRVAEACDELVVNDKETSSRSKELRRWEMFSRPKYDYW